jgi:hypothetical protein
MSESTLMPTPGRAITPAELLARLHAARELLPALERYSRAAAGNELPPRDLSRELLLIHAALAEHLTFSVSAIGKLDQHKPETAEITEPSPLLMADSQPEERPCYARVFGIPCEKPLGHDGPHSSVPPTTHNQESVT